MLPFFSEKQFPGFSKSSGFRFEVRLENKLFFWSCRRKNLFFISPQIHISIETNKRRKKMSEQSAEVQTIFNLIAEWRDAVEHRDMDRLFQNYHPNVIMFDCKPPHRLEGIAELRKCWEDCLPYFPEKFRCEHADMDVKVNGNMAFAHGLVRFVDLTDEQKFKDCFHWLRITVCYEKVDGKWLAVHEHCSMPYDPMTSKITFFDSK
jgi:ketosteroid isomerase-like protein